MEYDKKVAILQGSLLGFEKNPLQENDKLLKLSKVLEAYDKEEIVVSRKLFMCLLLNADLDGIDKMRQIPEYAPLSDLFRISCCIFTKLLSGKMWECFIDAIPTTIPINVLDQVVLNIMNILPKQAILKDSYLKLISLSTSILLVEKIHQDEKFGAKNNLCCSNSLLDLVAGESKNPSIDLKYKLFGILFLLRIAMSNKNEFIFKSVPSSSMFTLSLGVSTTAPKSRKCPIEIIQKLFTQYIGIAKEITVDTWIDLSDVSIDIIKSDFPKISIWDFGRHVPSNLQMLLAHYSFEVEEYMSQENILNLEASQILTNFAKEYNRISELRLEGSSFEEIVRKLRELDKTEKDAKISTADWKRSAYAEFLLSEHWDIVMCVNGKTNDCTLECFKTLTNNARFLKNFCDQLYKDVSVHKSRDSLQEEKVKLFLAVFKCLDVVNATKLLDTRIAEHGAHSELFLDHTSFHRNIRSFVNRFVHNMQESSNDSTELYYFLMQSPKEVIHYLVQEAIENKGKVGVISKILTTMPDAVIQCHVDALSGPCMLMTSLIMPKFVVIAESEMEEKSTNLFTLIEKISAKDERIAKDLILHFIRNASLDIIGAFSKVYSIILNAIRLDTFNCPEKIIIMVALCHTATLLYTSNYWGNAALIVDLPNILQLVYRIYTDSSSEKAVLENILITLLHRELQDYLIDKPSTNLDLRKSIRSQYFTMCDFEYVPKKDFIIELATCMPTLLPKEWSILHQNVKIEGHQISEFDLLSAAHLMITTNSIHELETIEYVVRYLGNIISLRLQEKKVALQDFSSNTLISSKDFLSKLCQVIGKFGSIR